MDYHAYYDKTLGRMVEGRPPRRDHVSRFPYECWVSGVHASQAQELRDFFAKHGEHPEVTSDGNPIYESRRQRKRLLKLRGMCDRGSD